MQTIYTIVVNYESEQEKRIVEPHLDDEINKIWLKLTTGNKNNTLTIHKNVWTSN